MATAAPQAYARVKLAASEELFSPLALHAGDDVGLLAQRCAAAFPHWGALPGQLRLHLVAARSAREPSDCEVERAAASGRLDVGQSLADAGVAPGAWLAASLAA